MNIGDIGRLRPNLYRDSVFDVPLDTLRSVGITGLVLDLDNTLIPRKSREIPDDLRAWLAGLTELGLRAVIVSNNFERRVGAVAAEVGLPLVARAGKPRARAFEQGMALLGTRPEDTAVIGDQLFTDVFGGNRLGLFTVLVVPLSDRELPHTRVLRQLERVVLRRLDKSGQLHRG